MKILNSGIFQLVILACIVPSSFSTIVEPPRDTAALVNTDNVRLNCSVSPGTPFKWETVVSWNLNNQLIYSSDKGPVNNNFTVTPDGSSISIRNLVPGLANIYTCAYITNEVSEAARVAVMNKLSCNQPNALTVLAGESFPFNCSTSYHSNVKSPLEPLTPTLSIMTGNGSTPVATDRAKEPGLFYLSTNITATPEMDNTDMMCKLYFENDPRTVSNSKALPPLYEDFCSFTLLVQHGVTVAKIETNTNDTSNIINVGQSISCISNGRPKPDIEWRDSNNTVISKGETLTMTMPLVGVEPKTFKCVATNNLLGSTFTAEDSVQLIVSTPSTGSVGQGLEPWAIGIIVAAILLFIIILVVVIVVICCLRRRKSEKPYKPPPKKNGKFDPTTKTLIYNPVVPNTGPGIPGIFTPGSNQNPARSPPPRPEYSSSPPVRTDYPQDDFTGGRSMNASVGHGDLGVSGLSNSRGGDINTIGSSRGNLPEAGRGQQGFSPRQGYGGSSEALNFPPLPPRHALDTVYHDSHQKASAPKRGRQNEHKSARSPPPPTSYLDPGFGRQPSITSTSTNRSNSSDGSRVAGRVDKNPGGRGPPKGGKRASPRGQGQPEGVRKPGKKSGKHSDTGYPSDAHSLQGSEV